MEISVEISLYPLMQDYKANIVEFIKRLRTYSEIEVVTNGMSTQIFGEYDLVMNLLQKEIKSELEHHRSMFVFKLGRGLLKSENLPKELM